jgi:hypothetical protein
MIEIRRDQYLDEQNNPDKSAIGHLGSAAAALVDACSAR